jgi:predicted ATP-grasp superfamily ATP-dependent carboligase
MKHIATQTEYRWRLNAYLVPTNLLLTLRMFVGRLHSQAQVQQARGKFVVIVTGSNEDISEANQILRNIGHKTRAEIAT